MLSRVWQPAIVAGITGCGKLVVDASNKLVVDATPKQKMIQLILASFPGSAHTLHFYFDPKTPCETSSPSIAVTGAARQTRTLLSPKLLEK